MPIGGTELASLVDDRLPGGVTERARDKYLTSKGFDVMSVFFFASSWDTTAAESAAKLSATCITSRKPVSRTMAQAVLAQTVIIQCRSISTK